MLQQLLAETIEGDEFTEFCLQVGGFRWFIQTPPPLMKR